jgi:pimeloyl-ACP methyl ester carboxylesterase
MSVPAGKVRAVFVHGAGGGGWEWSIWQRVFAAHGVASCAPDLQPVARGLAATQLDDYAAQVAQWCAASAGPLVLVGASLGGLLVLRVAPQVAPAAIVLINPLPPAGIDGRAKRRTYGDIVPWGRDRSLRGTQDALRDADDAGRLFAFRRWRDESGTVLRAAAAGADVVQPRCPVLMLASEHDGDTPPAASRALAERLGADFRLLRGASHVGPLLGRQAAAIAEETWQACMRRLTSSAAGTR